MKMFWVCVKERQNTWKLPEFNRKLKPEKEMSCFWKKAHQEEPGIWDDILKNSLQAEMMK